MKFRISLSTQQYTTPSQAAILFTLEPVVAVITSYILIHERLGKRSMMGAIFVFCRNFNCGDARAARRAGIA
jgi:drug/metabolite transporter (DMT)-like permease